MSVKASAYLIDHRCFILVLTNSSTYDLKKKPKLYADRVPKIKNLCYRRLKKKHFQDLRMSKMCGKCAIPGKKCNKI